MITKLVESLAQVIESLAPDEYALLKELSDRLIRIQKQNQPKSSTPVFIICEY